MLTAGSFETLVAQQHVLATNIPKQLRAICKTIERRVARTYPQYAEEATQEAVKIMLEKSEVIRNPVAFGFTTAYRIAARLAQRGRRIDPGDAEPLTSDRSRQANELEAAVMMNEDSVRRGATAFVRRLRLREVKTLYGALEGKRNKEIAAELGVAQSTVSRELTGIRDLVGDLIRAHLECLPPQAGALAKFDERPRVRGNLSIERAAIVEALVRMIHQAGVDNLVAEAP